MSKVRFPVQRHLRQLERQWEEINVYRTRLLQVAVPRAYTKRDAQVQTRWQQLGVVQQHLDDAILLLQELQRLS